MNYTPLEALVDLHQTAPLLGVIVKHLVVLCQSEQPISALLGKLRAAKTPKKGTRDGGQGIGG